MRFVKGITSASVAEDDQAFRATGNAAARVAREAGWGWGGVC